MSPNLYLSQSSNFTIISKGTWKKNIIVVQYIPADVSEQIGRFNKFCIPLYSKPKGICMISATALSYPNMKFEICYSVCYLTILAYIYPLLWYWVFLTLNISCIYRPIFIYSNTDAISSGICFLIILHRTYSLRSEAFNAFLINMKSHTALWKNCR